MKKVLCFSLLAGILLSVFPSLGEAQTEGTCEFTVTTRRTYEDYDPKHVLVIWVTETT